MTSRSLCMGLVLLWCSVSAEQGSSAEPAPKLNLIDAYVETQAASDTIHLPALVNDDLFLRRLTLDLLGRIPTTEELMSFRAVSASADSTRAARQQLIDLLLEHPQFPEFWSRAWTATLVGYGRDNRADRESLRKWLETQFKNERPLDQIAYQLLSAEGTSAFDGPVNFMLRHAEDPVVPLARIFLGVQLDCARCHDHPFDRWSQSDFEGMQRFFSTMRQRQRSPGTYELTDGQGEGNYPNS